MTRLIPLILFFVLILNLRAVIVQNQFTTNTSGTPVKGNVVFLNQVLVSTLVATNATAYSYSGNGRGFTNLPFFMQEIGATGNSGTSSLSVEDYGTNEVITTWPAFTATTAGLANWFPVTNTLNSVITEPQKVKPPNPMFQIVNGCQLRFTNTIAGNPVTNFVNFNGTLNFRQTNAASTSREIRFRLVKISDKLAASDFIEYPITRSTSKATVAHNTPSCISFNAIVAVETGERIMIQAAMGSITTIIVHDISITAVTAN